MVSSSGTSICTAHTCSAFHDGSSSPFANRSASTFCTASLPRKWSMRNTASSPATSSSVACSERDDSRSVPNGFSTTMRASSAMPSAPSMRLIGSIAAGGTER